LYRCTVLPLHRCTAVPFYPCTVVHLYRCTKMNRTCLGYAIKASQTVFSVAQSGTTQQRLLSLYTKMTTKRIIKVQNSQLQNETVGNQDAAGLHLPSLALSLSLGRVCVFKTYRANSSITQPSLPSLTAGLNLAQ